MTITAASPGHVVLRYSQPQTNDPDYNLGKSSQTDLSTETSDGNNDDKLEQGYFTCRWQLESGLRICGEKVAMDSISNHLRGHGVQNLNGRPLLSCQWFGCLQIITRTNLLRHVREVHLKQRRNLLARNLPT
ncbi:hypothetical protein BS17DRAFT_428320 [Gyrodon lividus]|nr:hypothetical protein BS17DRAFT_428320 [Gyrodon lividus]